MQTLARISMALLLVILAACGTKHVTVEDDEAIGIDVFRVVLPSEEQKENPVHGNETWFAYGAVSGKDAMKPVSGVANAQYFQDGTYALNVRINILIPEEGTHYEGWITNGTQKINIGTFISPTADVRMGLTFERKADLRSSLTILVTQEDDDDVTTTGPVVAEGKVKYYKR